MITYDKETQTALDNAQKTLKEFDLRMVKLLDKAIEDGVMDSEQAEYQFSKSKERNAILGLIGEIYATATSFTMEVPKGSVLINEQLKESKNV